MLDGLLERRPQIERAIVASTRGEEARRRTVELLRRRIGRVLEFTPEAPVPLGNDYAIPRYAGRDRLAAAVGANGALSGPQRADRRFRHGGHHRLGDGRQHLPRRKHRPGMQMRFRALHDYTASLPCAGLRRAVLLGRSTVEAIQAGVLQGMLFEIEGYIARLRAARGLLRDFYGWRREILCETD